MGTQSCSYIEQMVLIKGANEFQAIVTAQEGLEARPSSPCCLGRYQRPPPLALALEATDLPEEGPPRAPGF